MANILLWLEQSKGCKSRRRRSRYPKLSKLQGWVWRPTIWSKEDYIVCTDSLSRFIGKQEPHTEAMRPVEVTQPVPTFRDAAEVQNSAMGQYRNSRSSRYRHKDIRLTEEDLWKKSIREVSRCHSTYGNERRILSPSLRGLTKGKGWTLNRVRI